MTAESPTPAEYRHMCEWYKAEKARAESTEAKLAKLVGVLEANINTLAETKHRFLRWDKAHGEIDTAIKQTRAALHSSTGERT